jgi:peptidoglycan/xylan/chitin deacetylase (PgdA/CDA1 family)
VHLYIDFTIAMLLFAITLYPNLAHSQQFLFPYPTTDNNQTQDGSINSSSFSDNVGRRENNLRAANDSSGIDANSDNVNNYSSDSGGTNKVVILNFYDDEKDQFTNAKPTLDKYGFKGTFFIVCNWTSSNNTDRMTWRDVNQLYREGHDTESHTMTHSSKQTIC